jgi:poly(hydroxyalkanoate) depolymerase family esterase
MQNMNLKMPAGILHATRLVRGGKLMEATAAIQRALAGRPRSTDDLDATVIEGTPRVVNEPCPSSRPVDAAANSARFSATAPRTRTRREPGRFITSTYSNHAGTLEYKTYLPTRYEGQALALVVMLHGCKQDPDDFAAGTRMNELAEEQGFVVVYPKQAGKSNVSRCWNWFQTKNQQRDHGEPSLIAGLTRQVVDDYRLDARRVYVAGLSAGGAMAAIMGTTYPDVYSAVGIHSGLAYAAARDVPSAFAAMRGPGAKRSKRKHGRVSSTRTIPTIVFHGDSDTTVHPSNGEHVIAQASPQSSEHKVNAGQDAPSEASVENGEASGRAYTRTIYRDAAGKPVTEHWLVHGAGHAWSGGSANGSYSDPNGPDASREMLRFFLHHGK